MHRPMNPFVLPGDTPVSRFQYVGKRPNLLCFHHMTRSAFQSVEAVRGFFGLSLPVAADLGHSDVTMYDCAHG